MQHGPDPTLNTESTTEAPAELVVSGDEGSQDTQGVLHSTEGTAEVDRSSPADAGIEGVVTETETGSKSFFESMIEGQGMSAGSSMLMLAGVVLAMLIIMRSLMKSSAKRKMQTRTMGDPSQRIERINTRAAGGMEPARKAMVEAEDLTRRLGAVLDNKATRIEILLEEANERIAKLERAAQSMAARQVQSQQAQSNASVPPEALDRARLDQDREERKWSEERPVEPAEAPTPNEPTFRIDRGFKETPHQESPHPLTFPEQVDELAVKGLNAMEIANKLNRPVGEVELVLNLRRNSG